MAEKVAVVTGSNKGIGLATVERLAKELTSGWHVYLTARNESLGRQAVAQLNLPNVRFHQLDVSDRQSVAKLASFLKDKYGGLDILVNNAGIAYKQASPAPMSEQAEVTMKTNFFALLDVCDQLFPILRPHARVVHVSSFVALMVFKKLSPELKAKFLAPLSVEELNALMKQFVSNVKAGDHLAKGWADTCYGTTKLGVTVLAAIQQRKFDADPREDIIVNAACPGHVQTDMSSHSGSLTPHEGADTPTYLALLPPNTKENPKGQHVAERKIKQLE